VSRPSPLQTDLFGAPPVSLPPGLRYEAAFLGPDEEAGLLQHIAALPLAPMQYQGYTALRRVLSYGGKYDFSAHRLDAAEPIADWLQPLRARVADWLAVPAEAFTQALVAEYQPGTPLGWHRDVPDFEDVVGVSLLGDAVMRFRPYPPREPRRADVVKLALAPRSIYLLRGAARWEWQHSVAPTKTLRYSITFRTSRAEPTTSGPTAARSRSSASRSAG
jgi:alkylated DNA repair dioxygenase AlkB